MNHQTFDAGICIMTRIISLIGGKWKPIILYLVQRDVNRFGMLKKSMPKISKKVLTEQLRELETDGLISRFVLTAEAPQVVVYSLTEKGVATRALIEDMIAWGLKHFRSDYPEDVMQRFLQRPMVHQQR